MKYRVHRRAILLGILFGIAATLSGIVVIKYAELFVLVIMLWIVLPIMLLQFIRWVRAKLRK